MIRVWCVGFCVWDLEIVCNLVLEIWNLKTGASEICPLFTGHYFGGGQGPALELFLVGF